MHDVDQIEARTAMKTQPGSGRLRFDNRGDLNGSFGESIQCPPRSRGAMRHGRARQPQATGDKPLTPGIWRAGDPEHARKHPLPPPVLRTPVHGPRWHAECLSLAQAHHTMLGGGERGTPPIRSIGF
jgi:hypothetical protein